MSIQLLDRPASVSEAGWAAIVDSLTRREFVTGGVALGALGLGLAACGGSIHHDAARKGWSFTDALGRTIHLARRPIRIASLSDATTATLWSAGLHVIASQLAPGNAPMLRGTGVPSHGVAKIAVGNGDVVNLEALAAAKPDLIVDIAYDGKAAATAAQPKIAKVAPVVAVANGPTVDAVIDSAQRLVTACGIRLADTASHARYLAAASRLRKALAGKPGLRVAFFYVYGGDFYVYNPSTNQFLETLVQLGMNFMPVKASHTATTGDFQQEFSAELAPSLPVDLLIQSGGSWPITDPVWEAIPAVRAGQAVDSDDWGLGWYVYDYANYTVMLDRLTDVVEKAKSGIGPK